MKAIRVHEFGTPEVLRLEDVPTLRPGPGEVLVRVHAAGVNPVETYIRAGTFRTSLIKLASSRFADGVCGCQDRTLFRRKETQSFSGRLSAKAR